MIETGSALHAHATKQTNERTNGRLGERRQFVDDIPQTDVTSTVSMLAHCVCYLNSAINPIIYNHMNSKLRALARSWLGRALRQ